MPTFSWRGRTAKGQEVTGQSEASTADGAIQKLQQGGISVVSIREGTAAPAAGRAPRQREALIRLGIGIAVLVGAAAFLAMTSVTSIDCTRAASERVNCTIESGVLGAYPLPPQFLAHVTSVTVEDHQEAGTSTRHESRTAVMQHRLVLHGDGGSVATEWMAYPIGFSATAIDERLKTFLASPAGPTFHAWQVSFLALFCGAIACVALLFFFLSAKAFVAERTSGPAITFSGNAQR
jgi:hypothetical protein